MPAMTVMISAAMLISRPGTPLACSTQTSPTTSAAADGLGRRQPEGHHVHQAVVFGAEIAFRVGQARDAPVERIQNGGNENGELCIFEIAVHRLHDGVETGEKAGRGEQAGKDVNTPAPLLFPGGGCFVKMIHYFSCAGGAKRAITSAAPFTLSPSETSNCAFRGR